MNYDEEMARLRIVKREAERRAADEFRRACLALAAQLHAGVVDA